MPKPISRTFWQPAKARSTELKSVEKLPPLPLAPGLASESPIPLSKAAPLPSSSPTKILDFDVETVAAGFADPNWVPQKITCVAWGWVDEDEVNVRICGPQGIFGHPLHRASMLQPFLADLEKADMVTGHNLLRFDLPVLNAECLRLNLPPLKPVKVEDTMKILRTKGFKKGQDNLGVLLKTKEQKLQLNWQEWQDAYDEYDWPEVRERAVSDVRMHKEIRAEMKKRGWLKPPTMWRP